MVTISWLLPLIDVMIPLMLLIVLGWFACRFYLTSIKHSQALNSFLFQVCLPALAFRHIVHAGVYSVDW